MSNNEKSLKLKKVIVILGPTASGKTSLGVKLARRFKGEIVSADSRQVYRGMDIGTGKDLAEYEEIPYHLIDVANPQEVFDLAKFKKQAEAAIEDISERGRLPMVVGGSGLYLEALVDNYDLSAKGANEALRQELEIKTCAELLAIIKEHNQEFYDKINHSDRANHRRLVRYAEMFQDKAKPQGKLAPLYDFLLIGVNHQRESLKGRIAKRLRDRLEKEGLVEEVERLVSEGVSWRRLEAFGLEYKFIAYYLQGKLDYEAMVEKLINAINQFAKRQMTWFRRWQKNGAEIVWENDLELVSKKIEEFLK